ncbi:hypothetical protein NQ176_g2495 [Zarea fungicola]|uniref:Uncharacterized protein n=1 Tax=Zarea fungicola TaxID=93591 RepID=A0ACC1NP41_9HYPO|nr:hypothetical protein NQ176_g2495 [Lecanicillium fungicola]
MTDNLQGNAIFETLQASKQYKEADRISIYLAMPAAEAQTDAIVRHALAAGKQVLRPLPAHLESLRTGHPCPQHGHGTPAHIDAAAVSGRERILGDARSGSGRAPATLDLMLVPGVAFNADPDGGIRRLGHGKGFYDFFLNRYFERVAEHGGHGRSLHLLGLALKEQWLSEAHGEEVPMGLHDRKLHSLILGSGETK